MSARNRPHLSRFEIFSWVRKQRKETEGLAWQIDPHKQINNQIECNSSLAEYSFGCFYHNISKSAEEGSQKKQYVSQRKKWKMNIERTNPCDAWWINKKKATQEGVKVGEIMSEGVGSL